MTLLFRRHTCYSRATLKDTCDISVLQYQCTNIYLCFLLMDISAPALGSPKIIHNAEVQTRQLV